MPQSPNAVAPAVTPSGVTTPLKVDAQGRLLVSDQVTSDDPLTPVTTIGTIAVTNTFQQLLPANPLRQAGGFIQNNGTATMDVYFGTVGTATVAKSLHVTAGTVVFLSNIFGPGTYQGVVAITGTAADGFLASENTGS